MTTAIDAGKEWFDKRAAQENAFKAFIRSLKDAKKDALRNIRHSLKEGETVQPADAAQFLVYNTMILMAVNTPCGKNFFLDYIKEVPELLETAQQGELTAGLHCRSVRPTQSFLGLQNSKALQNATDVEKLFAVSIKELREKTEPGVSTEDMDDRNPNRRDALKMMGGMAAGLAVGTTGGYFTGKVADMENPILTATIGAIVGAPAGHLSAMLAETAMVNRAYTNWLQTETNHEAVTTGFKDLVESLHQIGSDYLSRTAAKSEQPAR